MTVPGRDVDGFLEAPEGLSESHSSNFAGGVWGEGEERVG